MTENETPEESRRSDVVAPRGDGESVRVLAHRGFAGVAPENTVAAAIAAARAGANAIEIDVMPCAEGDPVVFHDDRLDAIGGSRGVTDATGVVWKTPREVVRDAEVLDSGETVPLLSELAAAVPDGVALNVELKRPGSAAVWSGPDGTTAEVDRRGAAAGDGSGEGAAEADPWGPFADAVLDALSGCENDVLFSSFSDAALDAIRTRVPEAPVAVLFAADPAAGLERARRLDAEVIHPAADLLIERDGARVSDLDPHGLAAAAREEGRAVNAWTATTWYEAARLREAGADGIIADCPGLLGESGSTATGDEEQERRSSPGRRG